MFCHVQRRMSHEPLQPKRIAAAIDKIFPCEGVTEKVYACLLDSPCTIIMLYREPQSVLGQHSAVLIAKEIVVIFSLSYEHIIAQNRDHLRAEWICLNLSVFVVTEDNCSRS